MGREFVVEPAVDTPPLPLRLSLGGGGISRSFWLSPGARVAPPEFVPSRHRCRLDKVYRPRNIHLKRIIQSRLPLLKKMSAKSTSSIALHGKSYRLPQRPTVVVCIDGFDPEYLQSGIEDSILPTWHSS